MDWDLNLGHKELRILPSCVRSPCSHLLAFIELRGKIEDFKT